MKLCNDTITVINRRWDATNGYDAYNLTVIRGASWYHADASAVDSNGLHATDRFVVRIPTDADTGGKTYADPATYEAAQSASGLWTLKNGDLIVKAEVTTMPETIASLRGSYGEIMTVLSVTDNRRAPNASHFKVVGG